MRLPQINRNRSQVIKPKLIKVVSEALLVSPENNSCIYISIYILELFYWMTSRAFNIYTEPNQRKAYFKGHVSINSGKKKMNMRENGIDTEAVLLSRFQGSPLKCFK